MSTHIKYRLAARTEAAGKYDPSAPQEGNEDNYGLISDIAKPEHRTGFDEVADLGEMGLLVFVADGMGGHSAGEVASKIAVDTVYEAFAECKVKAETASSHRNRSRYLEDTIREADKRIRKHSKQNKECEGMGSTLIIAWLMGDELTVSWCGDSRAYLYHSLPSPNIEMVSEDHSYVQELVQRGVIPYEATFGHPRGNIVTRCLGGGGGNAEPESRLTHVAKGDIVLLCSDGLSGVLFDDGRLFDGHPITEENICDTITANRQQLRECNNALFAAAERQNWYDNVTAILCEVIDGPERRQSNATAETEPSKSAVDNPIPQKRNRMVLFAAGLLLVVVGGVAGALLMHTWNNHDLAETAAAGDTTTQQAEEQYQRKPYVEILEFNADKLVISGEGDCFIVRIDGVDTVITDTVYRFDQRLSNGNHTASAKSVCGQDTSVAAQKSYSVKRRQPDTHNETDTSTPMPNNARDQLVPER